MKKYEFFDHTADIGVRVYGGTAEEVFLNAASAMFSLIYDIEKVEAKEEREITLFGADGKKLLVRWLQELLYLYDAHALLYKDADFLKWNEYALKAKVYFDIFDPKKHLIHGEVKNVTYHQLSFGKREDGWYAQIIFDV